MCKQKQKRKKKGKEWRGCESGQRRRRKRQRKRSANRRKEERVAQPWRELFLLYFLVPVYHRSIDRHFPPTVPHATEENMIYRGRRRKQQRSLTNTQRQPRPHADTMPHYKSGEVAGWEREGEGGRGGEGGERGEGGRDGQSQADRERCRRGHEVMGERWRRISKCFLKYKQPSASIAPPPPPPWVSGCSASQLQPINNG